MLILQISHLGSNWNNDLNTSLAYWNLNNEVSNRNRNISSQYNMLNNKNKKNNKLTTLPIGKKSRIKKY